jgi:hypothetical protein
MAPRPEGYNPLGEKNLDPAWIARLGQCGKDCFNAILNKDAAALGASLNESMLCWEHLLPRTMLHPVMQEDLLDLLHFYQAQYPGAMYSGCGGGYFYVISEEAVPGGFHFTVRISSEGKGE